MAKPAIRPGHDQLVVREDREPDREVAAERAGGALPEEDPGHDQCETGDPEEPGRAPGHVGRAVVPGADAEDHEEGELHGEAEGLDLRPVPSIRPVRARGALDPITAAEIEEGEAARDREREHRGAVAPARGGDHDRGDRPSRPDVQSEISMRGALVPSVPAGTQATPRRLFA